MLKIFIIIYFLIKSCFVNFKKKTYAPLIFQKLKIEMLPPPNKEWQWLAKTAFRHIQFIEWDPKKKDTKK